MKLVGIKIEKFKKIDEIEIRSGSLNVLVGTNGSGKSSVLQAAHLASCLLRQADRIRVGSTSTIAVMDLDYLPSDEYSRLGHGAKWGNKKNTPSSKITFVFEDDQGNEVEAVCEARAARNAGISVTGQLPEAVRSMFRGRSTYFSGFIPGISGVPNQEAKQSKRVVMKACSFGDSNVYLRNALNLLEEGELRQIETWLSQLMGEVSIGLDFVEDRDLVIKAEVTVDGMAHPLELLGAGYIQLIQIFCYALLFKPKILLIDEPDIHLHPNIQEKLASVLSSIAIEKEMSVILTTHSPFILRGSPLGSNVYWLDGGRLVGENREASEMALGWGAFGRKIIFVSEDKDTSFLRKLVSQWPNIEKFVTFHPGQGYQNLPDREQAKELFDALGGRFKVLVHRDRDSLTDEEVARLSNEYACDGVQLWFTEFSDIEGYFCSACYISDLLNCDVSQGEAYLEGVLSRNSVPEEDQFKSQRKAHNEELYPEGGSPENGEVWAQFRNRPLRGYKGKFIFKQLKNAIPGNAFSEQAILGHEAEVELASSLRRTLEDLIQG